MALHIGLIGRGRWGKNIEATLAALEDVRVLHIERGAEMPSDLDGICIATPSSTHAAIALPFLHKGIPTFIEKPLTTSLSDAELLRDASRASGALIHVGHIQLYNPAFQAIMKILPELGDLRSVVCEGMNNSPRTESSILWDWLPHVLSMAITLLKREPDSVEVWATGEPHASLAITKFHFGEVVLMSVMSSEMPQKRRVLTFTGEKGTLVFDDRAEKKLTLKIGSDKTYPDFGKEFSLTLELRAFIDAIKTKSTSTESLDLGIMIVKHIEAAEKMTRR